MGELIHQKACMYMDAFSLAQPDDVTTAMTAYQQVSEKCTSSQYALLTHPLNTSSPYILFTYCIDTLY